MIPCRIDSPKEIVLVGSGVSLDMAHPSEWSRNDDRIVIALNAVGCVIEADYNVMTDRIAIHRWGGNGQLGKDQFNISPRGMLNKCDGRNRWPGVTWLSAISGNLPRTQDPLEVYIEGDPFCNTRTLAVHLIAGLNRQFPSIERIAYIGMDSAAVTEHRPGRQPRNWQYARTLRSAALDAKHRARFYAGDPNNKHTLQLMNYKSVFPQAAKLFRGRHIQHKMDCKSFLDWGAVPVSTKAPAIIIRSAFREQKSRRPNSSSLTWLYSV